MSCNMFVLPFLFLSSYVVNSATPSPNISPNFPSKSESRKLNESIRNFLKGESIQDYLKKINKPAIKTIKSPDGDLIDCVLFDQQPGFDHPLLQGQRNKTITPPKLPEDYLPDNNTAAFDPETFQIWRLSGESCPESTVPIKRTTEEDIMGSIKSWDDDDAQMHEHAVGAVNKGKFYGLDVIINVWAPKVENPGEFSISQIWVMAGGGKNGALNTVEVGYMVNYVDPNPRIFIYWTRDAYQHTGCYNMACAGFIQINNQIALGAAINGMSRYNGEQRDMRFILEKDMADGNWWVSIQRVAIGYYHLSLFTPHLLGTAADMVEFGGEIVNTGSYGQHTKTQMGSGHFPGEGYKRAAYVRHVHVVDSASNFVRPPWVGTGMEKAKCYDAKSYMNPHDANWGYYVYYGGSGGRNPGCT